MNDDDGVDDRFDAWLAAAAVGTLDEADRAALNQRLRTDAAARARWIAYTTLHGMLHWEAPRPAAGTGSHGTLPQTLPDPPPQPARRSLTLARRARRSWWQGLAAAALLMAGVLGGWTVLDRLRHPPVAMLVASEDAQWEQGTGPDAGDGIPARTLRLHGGLAHLRFGGGAIAILQGPAELVLRSPSTATLLHGRLVVRADGEARGFAVDAAGMEIIDRGTEFAVQALAGGHAEVHVFEGAVELATPRSSAILPLHLSAQEAVRIDGERQVIERTAFRPDAFVRILARDLAAGDLTHGLIGWWPLDASAGDIVEDLSGHARHGRLVNMGFSTGSTAGRVGNALHFNGHNGMVRVPYDTAMDLGTMTLAAWIRPARQLPPTRDAVIAMQQGGWGMGVLVNDHAKSVFWHDDRLVRFRFEEGVWYHLAMTYDGTTRRMYVDARPVGIWPSRPPRRSREAFTIGGMGAGNDKEPFFFNGTIDDVRLYDRALAADEVRTLYLRGLAGMP